MKNFFLVLASFAFVCWLVTTLAVGQARIALQIENEQKFCADRGFTDLQVCREWWIKSGDPSRKR